MPMDMADMLKRLNNKFFEGDEKDGYPAGQGTYRFANGTEYQGSFYEGVFDGQGTLSFPKGGKFVATWDLGKLVKGVYYYDDDLEYTASNWKYCTDADRRFWTEMRSGIELADEPQLTNQHPSFWIPESTHDIGSGYYDPKDGQTYSYEGEKQRAASMEEALWAVRKCRIGAKEEELDLELTGTIEEGEESKPATAAIKPVTAAAAADTAKPGTAAKPSTAAAAVDAAAAAASPPGALPAPAVAVEVAEAEDAAGAEEVIGGAQEGEQDVVFIDSDATAGAVVGDASEEEDIGFCAATMGGSHHINNNNNVCQNCGLTREFLSRTAAPSAAASSSAGVSTATPCPATMGGRCDYSAGRCLNCDREEGAVAAPQPASDAVFVQPPKTSCSSSMGKPHNFHAGLCLECGRRGEGGEAAQATEMGEPCPATMGGQCDFAGGEVCMNCDRGKQVASAERTTGKKSRPASACSAFLGRPHAMKEGSCEHCGRHEAEL